MAKTRPVVGIVAATPSLTSLVRLIVMSSLSSASDQKFFGGKSSFTYSKYSFRIRGCPVSFSSILMM